MTRTLQLFGLLLIALLATGTNASTVAAADNHPCIRWGSQCLLCESTGGCIVMLCDRDDGTIGGAIIC